MSGSRRPALLAPVLWLSDRVRTSTRLAVLVVVLLVPGLGATYAYSGGVGGQLGFTGSERDGTVVVHPALAAMTEIAVGRVPDLSRLRAAGGRRRTDPPLHERGFVNNSSFSAIQQNMTIHRRVTVVLTLAATIMAALLATPASASSSGSRRPLPTTLQLPDGFQPEGIAIGPGPFAYFGSRADGRIFRINLISGAGSVISPAVGTASLGLKTDLRGRLFVSGGGAGNGRVVDIHTGAVLASYQFATPAPGAPSFVNDVALLGGAAYFTDSNRAVLYTLTLGRHGELPASFRTLPLTGDFVLTPGVNNLNGIAPTPDGRALIAVQSNTGLLFRIDPATGVTRQLDTGGATFVNGDGLLLVNRTLYVVQNRLNTVVAVRLDKTGTSGEVREQLTDIRFDVPTTIAQFGNRLYLPNARFTTPPTPETTYTAVAIRTF
jgi:sugar lactone lactonase YvrE